MTTELRTVPAHLPVAVCLKLMRTEGYRHLPVLDAQGLMLGVATDIELMRRQREGSIGDWVAGAARHVPRAGPDDPAARVVSDQLAAQASCTLIVDTVGQPLGLFTEHDALDLAMEWVDPSVTVARIMTRGGLFVPPFARADETLEHMVEARIHHMLVAAGNQLRGVLSHRDLVGQGERFVGEVASTRIHMCDPPTPVPTAASILRNRRVGCLPVVDGEDLVGLVTRTDLLRALIGHLERESEE